MHLGLTPDQVRELGVVAFNTATIYLFLVALVRLLGRRQLAEFTPVDLLITIMLGSAVETAMVHGQTSLKAGIVAALVLFAVNKGLSTLSRRSRALRRILGFGPLVVVHDGRIVQENLKKAGLTVEDVEEGLRQRECENIGKCRFAVVESDGELNVIRKGA